MGDLDIDEISKDLGLAPSYTHRKGEVDRLGDKFDSDIWILSSPHSRDASLEEHIDWLCDQFTGKATIIETLQANAKVDMFCGITSPEQSGFSVSAVALSKLAALGIQLEVSLILLESD